MKYLVVVEQTESGFSAYSPDVPGCVATAQSRADVEREIADAISFHLEGMQAEGIELPTPHASTAYVDIPA
ncbi:MAG: type II toxin-antitoxin system HicB family antitoxin [Myxococcales bacterium]